MALPVLDGVIKSNVLDGEHEMGARMRAKVSSTHRRWIPRWRLLGWEGLILGVVAAWLFMSCVSMQAADPKPDEHPQTAAVQQERADGKR